LKRNNTTYIQFPSKRASIYKLKYFGIQILQAWHPI